MYSHGRVWDSKPDEGEPRMIEVGNAIEAVARSPERYFTSKEAAEDFGAKAKARAQAEQDRIAAEAKAEAEAKARSDASAKKGES